MVKRYYHYIFLFTIALSLIPVLAADITLNEVMFNAVGVDDYDEYIEIVNICEDHVDLSGMWLKINESIDSLVFIGEAKTLAPGAYCLILDRGYLVDGNSHTYDPYIPTNALKCTIQDNSFGKGGLPNTEQATIILFNQTGDTLSCVITNPDQGAGYSEEKIDIYGDDDSNNWGNSIKLYGTPCYENSIAIKDFDLAVLAFGPNVTESSILPDGNIEFRARIKNVGRYLVTDTELRFGEDFDRDTVLQTPEQIDTKFITLMPGDSADIFFTALEVGSGWHFFLCELGHTDDNPLNDGAFTSVKVPFQKKCIVINEFMYAPKTDYGGEWIELFNVSADTINLAHWQIGDNSSRITITSSDILVPPAEYVLLSSNETIVSYWDIGGIHIYCNPAIPTLNNTEDSIVVRDLCGHVIDSLKYNTAWGYQTGISLERVDSAGDSDQPENWALSQDSKGGTPGKINSVVAKDFDLSVKRIGLVEDSENLKPGAAAEIFIVVENIGRLTVNDAEFYLGLDRDRDSLLQEDEVLYVDILTISPGDSIVLYPTIFNVESGINKILCSIVSVDDNPGNNWAYYEFKVPYLTGTVAINEFMYNPGEDFGGEWIELFNVSTDTINLADWQIGDNSTRIKISSNDILVPPSEYVLLSSDESIGDYWNIGGIHIQREQTLPILNNTEDSIVVRDLCGHVIDSLKYRSSWGNQMGVSLERIDPRYGSENADNWTLSQDSVGGTPGWANSQMIKTYDLSIDTLYVVTRDAIHGDPVEIGFMITNNGVANIDQYSVDIVLQKRGIFPNNETIFDTVLIYNTGIISKTQDQKKFLFESVPGGIMDLSCTVIFDNDEKAENNQRDIHFPVGYPPASVVINEVMNIPLTGEAEWFELFNTTEMIIDLNQWRFRDAGGEWRILANATEPIEPFGFSVVAARQDFAQMYPQFSGNLIVPTNFPTLNNTSDSLFLSDGNGHLIDQVCFRQSWGGGTGISIERRDPNVGADNENNWGSCINSGGATPGAENSILKFQHDLIIAENGFEFVDSTLALIHKAIFNVKIINAGSNPSGNFSFEVFHDKNKDNRAAPNELVWSLYNIPLLLPDTSIVLDGDFYTETSGRCRYIAIVAENNENNPADNITTADLLVSYPMYSVTLNEFLANPNGEQVEFVELFLPDVGDNVNFDGWRIGNNRSLGTIHHDLQMESVKYIVFCRDSTIFDKFTINSDRVLIPDKWPGLSNTSDKIVLKDLTGQTIDSLIYTSNWGISAGKSMEKRYVNDPGDIFDSWAKCIDIRGATPGEENSITPRLFDLKLDSVSTDKYVSGQEQEIKFICWYSNVGQSKCSDAQICVLKDDNEIISKGIIDILPGEIDTVHLNIGTLASGIHRLKMFVDWEKDLNHKNDTLKQEIRIIFSSGSLVLSEFMANPHDIITENQSTAEYIEIFNPGEKVCVTGWMISDENTGVRIEISEQKQIKQNGYFVFASDSSIFKFSGLSPSQVVILEKFPSFNNEEDEIYLLDPTGRVIDSLFYGATWNISQGISMERVYFENPNFLNNWRHCTNPSGGTPGLKNSVTIINTAEKPGINVSPNPFSPNGDGIDDETAIMYILPFPSARLTIQVYDLVGRLIYEPAQNITTSAQGSVYWDGSSQQGNKARIGMYIVRCSATDTASDKTVGYITTLVLAR